MYVDMCTYIYIYAPICICKYANLYICLCVCRYLSTYLHTQQLMYVYIYMCVYIYRHTYMYDFMHTVPPPPLMEVQASFTQGRSSRIRDPPSNHAQLVAGFSYCWGEFFDNPGHPSVDGRGPASSYTYCTTMIRSVLVYEINAVCISSNVEPPTMSPARRGITYRAPR